MAEPEILDFNDPDLPPLQFRLNGKPKVWELPHLGLLPLSVKTQMHHVSADIRRAKKGGKSPSKAVSEKAALAMIDVIEAASPGITAHLSEHQIQPLFEAWGKHSEITAGES